MWSKVLKCSCPHLENICLNFKSIRKFLKIMAQIKVNVLLIWLKCTSPICLL